MKCLVILLLLVANAVHSQYALDVPVDSATGLITYSRVIDAKDQAKKDIYNKVKAWVYKTYVSPKDVINVNDPDAGILVIKSLFQSKKGGSITTYNYDMSIYIKDNKLKATVDNLKRTTSSPGTVLPDNSTNMENALLFTKDSPEMQYIDARKAIQRTIEAKMDEIFNSIAATVNSKAMDF